MAVGQIGKFRHHITFWEKPIFRKEDVPFKNDEGMHFEKVNVLSSSHTMYIIYRFPHSKKVKERSSPTYQYHEVLSILLIVYEVWTFSKNSSSHLYTMVEIYIFCPKLLLPKSFSDLKIFGLMNFPSTPLDCFVLTTV